MSSSMCSDMVPIEESINSSFANLVTIFENNDLDLVISLADANAEKSLYHSSLKAMIGIIKAALTLDNVSYSGFTSDPTQKVINILFPPSG